MRSFFVVSLVLALSVSSADAKRTIIALFKESKYDDHLFIRGGLGPDRSPLSVRLSPQPEVTYPQYELWREQFPELNEEGEGENVTAYNGLEAPGVPLIYTINSDPAEGTYSEMNIYGDGYWILDFDANCEQGEEIFFEGFLATEGGYFEPEFAPAAAGRDGEEAPRLHVAKCGYSNGFVWHETGAPSSSSGGPSHIPGNGYRTDVFVHYVTIPGEDLFIYGNDDNPDAMDFDSSEEYPMDFTDVDPDSEFYNEDAFVDGYWHVSGEVDCSALDGNMFGLNFFMQDGDERRDEDPALILQDGAPAEGVHFANCDEFNYFNFDDGSFKVYEDMEREQEAREEEEEEEQQQQQQQQEEQPAAAGRR